jgi:uncharacterized membrane protein YcaP (DUF421 family)
MDSIVRGLVVYAVLLVLFRLMGKRTLAEITTFDAVLLLIISEAIQQALIDNDNSMTNAFLIVVTLLLADVLLSFLSYRFKRVDELVNDTPLILIEDGHVHLRRLDKSRVSEDDILEQGRRSHGIERLDQIKYAILERNGGISIVPRQVSWIAPPQPEPAPSDA